MTDKTPEQLVRTYGDMVYRLAYAQTRSRHDADDIFQDVFLQVVRRRPQFASEAHEKAWLIRVSVNACRDLLKSIFHRRTVPLDDLWNEPEALAPEHREVLEAVLALPQKYRSAVYLHYYEGYTAPEIGRILDKNVNTVYTLLTRARTMLRETLGGDGNG